MQTFFPVIGLQLPVLKKLENSFKTSGCRGLGHSTIPTLSWNCVTKPLTVSENGVEGLPTIIPLCFLHSQK